MVIVLLRCGLTSCFPILCCTCLSVSEIENRGSLLVLNVFLIPQAICPVQANPCTLLCSVLGGSGSIPSLSGGLDVKTQEAALRSGPDILIATPGRLIDHLHNCPSFHLSSVEVLILDEADR